MTEGTLQRVCRQAPSTGLSWLWALAICLMAASWLPLVSGAPAAAAAAVKGSARASQAAPSVPRATVPSSPLTVSLTAVTPAVALPKATVKISGRVRNTGRIPVIAPRAHAHLGQDSLSGRQAVSDWSTSSTAQSGQSLPDVAQAPLGKTLAPGAVAAFTLNIPASAINHRASFAVLPLQIEVVGTTRAGTLRSGRVSTFLPALAAVKAYEPLSIAWLVPLTLDPDPALHGQASRARSAAWNSAIGPGSRLDRVIQGTEGSNVTWAIDPAILGPRQTLPAAGNSALPSATPSPSQPAPPGATVDPDPVTVATSALARRLRAAAPRHTLWSLPYADPDLTALLPLSPRSRDLPAIISRSSALESAVGPARTDIAWPVAATLTLLTQDRLKEAFVSPGLAAAVSSSQALPGQPDSAGSASRKTSTGLPLLAYDEGLSRIVAETSSRAAATITIQRFLAESMAVLAERPGTPDRSILIAEPRTFAGDPSVLRSLFAAVSKAPWLIPTTTDRLLATSQKMAPSSPGDFTTNTDETPRALSPSPPVPPPPADPLRPGRSPLTSAAVAKLPGTLKAINGIGGILSDRRAFSDAWTDAQIQQLSTRWRDQERGFAAINAATKAAISQASRSVRVAPSSVNFFADTGVLQVTVVNDLAVPIHDVHLRLTPAQPRLRIEQQPGPLKIGARSRTNARVPVTSVAAGLVSVEAVLTTQNGTPLGQNARVNVRVQPPAGWIYWILGGLAGVILVLGTTRSLRRGSTRASRPDPQESPVHD